MDVNIFSAFLLFLFFQSFSKAQFQNCDNKREIDAIGNSITIRHPNLWNSGSCRYKVFAPPDSIILATCDLKSSCGAHNFLISRNGEADLRDNASYCGTGTGLKYRSIANEIVVAIDMKVTPTASFTCRFTSIRVNENNCDCGWSVSTKIVGGVPTKINGFVSHGALVDKPTKSLFCGTTLLSQYWSLTAAHCFSSYPTVSNTVLLVGDHDTTTGTETKWAAVYALASYVKHPGFVEETSLNDLALVKTTLYVRFTSGVGPACLPYAFNGVTFVGNDLTAVGWGTTSFGGSSSNTLLQTGLRVISNTQCQSSYSNIDVTKLCTYGNKTRDTCSMDSGGGLYWSTQDGRQYIISVVNYGTYCASSYPSVNSRVDRYFSWIMDTTGAFFCRK